MEKMTVVGRRKVDFTPEGQTNSIVGCNLYCNHYDSDVSGLMAEKLFINVTSSAYGAAMALQFPCEIGIDFNRRGKVEAITVLDEPVAAAKK